MNFILKNIYILIQCHIQVNKLKIKIQISLFKSYIQTNQKSNLLNAQNHPCTHQGRNGWNPNSWKNRAIYFYYYASLNKLYYYMLIKKKTCFPLEETQKTSTSQQELLLIFWVGK